MRTIIVGWVMLVVGCHGADTSDSASAASSQFEVSAAKAAAPAPTVAPSPGGTALYMNLVGLSHLADLRDAHGWLIDFGTPARMKYTAGNWNSGWTADATIDGATTSLFGKSARVQAPGVGQSVTIRAKSVGATKLTVYVSDKALRTFDVTPANGFVELTVALPAEARSGPASLLLRANRLGTFKGKKASFAVDWICIGASADPGPSELNTAPVVRRLAVAGVTRDAVIIPAGGTMRWYAEVPAEGTLVFGAASTSRSGGTIVVSVQTDGLPSKTLLQESLADRWSDQQRGLGMVAGSIAEFSFAAGPAPVALSDLRIVRKQSSVQPLQKRAQNVIVLLIDTLRASKLKLYYPKSRVETPALDRFAKTGALFERAQTPENWTKPAVASLLTSLHPMTHRTKEQGSKLPQDALMLSEVYKKAGFKTASFIANGYVSRAFGFDQGWDHYTNYIREERNTEAPTVFGEAAKWIEKNKDKRFFVYIQTIDPHVPYDPPDAYLKKYDPKPYSGQVQNRRTHLMLDDAKQNPKKYNFTARDKEHIEALHDGEISYHDEHFGIFLKKLETLGLEENTIFVVVSDHGEEFQEHGSWGHGHSVYQELLGVPLLVRWPGVVPAGARISPVVTTLDVGPTVLEATGTPIPKAFEGRSLMGFLRSDWPPAPHVAFSDFMDNRRVIRGGNAKYILRASLSEVTFDLGKDPWEKHELTLSEKPIANRYLQILLGQYLGAEDRGDWLHGGTKGQSLKSEKQQMTPELCRQLVALGYISAECDHLLGR